MRTSAPALGRRRIPVGVIIALILAVLLILPAVLARAEDAPRQVNLFWIDVDDPASGVSWTASPVVVSKAGGSAPLTDCVMQPYPIPANGALVIEDFAEGLCERNGIAGVATLTVPAGSDAKYVTRARSVINGVTNTAVIPELPAPLAENGAAWFRGIENAESTKTFLAIVSRGGPTRVRVLVYDDQGEPIGQQLIDVDAPFLWRPLSVPVALGSIRVENLGLGFGGPGVEAGKVFVFAAVGSPDGGAAQFLVGDAP